MIDRWMAIERAAREMARWDLGEWDWVLFGLREALEEADMSADNRASVVGQNVYKEGEQVPFGVVAGHLGETEGTHYYSVQTESGTHIYDGADLRLMTHEGLRPFAAYDEELSRQIESQHAGTAGYFPDPSVPHPFEQVGKAGADPVASAQGPDGVTAPVYGPDFAEYQDFLRWRAGIRDYGDSTDATPLSPAESKAADKGAVEVFPTTTTNPRPPTATSGDDSPAGVDPADPELPPMESGGRGKDPVIP